MRVVGLGFLNQLPLAGSRGMRAREEIRQPGVPGGTIPVSARGCGVNTNPTPWSDRGWDVSVNSWVQLLSGSRAKGQSPLELGMVWAGGGSEGRAGWAVLGLGGDFGGCGLCPAGRVQVGTFLRPSRAGRGGCGSGRRWLCAPTAPWGRHQRRLRRSGSFLRGAGADSCHGQWAGLCCAIPGAVPGRVPSSLARSIPWALGTDGREFPGVLIPARPAGGSSGGGGGSAGAVPGRGSCGHVTIGTSGLVTSGTRRAAEGQGGHGSARLYKGPSVSPGCEEGTAAQISVAMMSS